jgi:hypothetical protein
MTSMPRVRQVKAGKGFALQVKWHDGSRVTVDLTGLIHHSRHFRRFVEHPEEFAQVRPVAMGSGIGWDNGLDYSAATLKTLADEQCPLSGRELLAFEKERALNTAETACLFDVTPKSIANYRARKQLPSPVAFALRRFMEDDTIFAAHYRPVEQRKRGRPKTAAQKR